MARQEKLKRLPHIFLALTIAAVMLGAVFGISEAQQDIVAYWDFNNGDIGPWSAGGFSVQSNTLKLSFGLTNTNLLDKKEMLEAMTSISLTAENVQFSYVYTTSDIFSSTIEMIAEGLTNTCHDNSLTGSGLVSCSITHTSEFSAVRIIITGPPTKTVYFDNKELRSPQSSSTIDYDKFLFPTPAATPFLALPTPFPIPTVTLTTTLTITPFWDIDNWSSSISMAQTIFTLKYMPEFLTGLGFIVIVGLSFSLLRAIISGRESASQQAVVNIQGAIESRQELGENFDILEEQQLLRDEVERLRREQIASRFRSEARRTFGRGRR